MNGLRNMEVEFFASSTLFIKHGSVRLLTDPWLVDGAYYGSWAHNPSVRVSPSELNPTHIYISHIHPDHCDLATLNELPNRPPVIIFDFRDKRLKNLISDLGFPVREISSGEKCSLSSELDLHIYSMKVCDIAHCGSVIPCGINIDSLAVVRTKDEVVFNTNDFRFVPSLAKRLLEEHGKPDVAFLGHTGAGPFPQCFALSEESKKEYAEKKKRQFLNQALSYAEIWKPRLSVPFAGAYQLQGKLAELNDFRGMSTPSEASDELSAVSNSTVLFEGNVVGVGNLDVSRNTLQPIYKPDNGTYADDLVTALFMKQGFPKLSKLIDAARSNLWERQQKTGYFSDWYVEFQTERERYGFNFRHENVAEQSEPYLIIKLSHAMLWGLLTGLFNYYDAHLGSHLQFDESPIIYDMNLFSHLPFFRA